MCVPIVLCALLASADQVVEQKWKVCEIADAPLNVKHVEAFYVFPPSRNEKKWKKKGDRQTKTTMCADPIFELD